MNTDTKCHCSKKTEKDTVEYYQLWAGLSRAQTSRKLQQCEVILTENMNKRQLASKEELWKIFQEGWRTDPGNCLKKLQESLPFRLCWRIKVITPNIDFWAHYNCTVLSCTVFPYVWLTKTRKSTHIKKLHWFPDSFRIDFKILSLFGF